MSEFIFEKLHQSLDQVSVSLKLATTAIDKLIELLNSRKLKAAECLIRTFEEQIPRLECQIDDASRAAACLNDRIMSLSVPAKWTLLDCLMVTRLIKTQWRAGQLASAQIAKDQADARMSALRQRMAVLAEARDKAINVASALERDLNNQRDISFFARILRWLRTVLPGILLVINALHGRVFAAFTNCVDLANSVQRLKVSAL